MGASFTATVDGIVLRQKGTKDTGLWGVEHYPILRHVALQARETPCVLVEAGAHQGTLALLGAKRNCTVYGFDSVLRHLRLARSNAQLNNIPPEMIRFTHKKLGDTPGSRLDEMVPSAARVSLLKMDIDGMDVIAMRGASGLFSGAGVDAINIEFSPAKHEAASGVGDAAYLQELHAKGYEAYLDNCYKLGMPQLEEDISRVLDGARCLAIVQQGNDRETAEQSRMFGCLVGGRCDAAALQLVRRQHIPEHKYAAFTRAIVQRARAGEVDLVLVKRTPEQLGRGRRRRRP